MSAWIYTGLLVGLVFGFALQRGRFCMNSAFRDIIVLKEYTLLKAVGIAILVEMVGFELLAQINVIQLNPKPFFWGANIVGGLIFGVGMVLAGGCASGITYRVGEGMVGAMSAVAGFALAGLMSIMGVLNPVVNWLQSNTVTTTASGEVPTLANILGVSHAVMAFGIAIVAVAVWFILGLRNRETDVFATETPTLWERIFKRGWGWLSTGILIGLIGVVAFPLSAESGRNYPLGITGGYTTIGKSLVTNTNALSWESMLVIGAIVGAGIAARVAGEFKLRAPAPGTILQTFVGGFLMAFGAVTSSGCNIGHILSGVPQLSIGSIVGGASIVMGGWIAAYLLFVLPEKRMEREMQATTHA